MPTRLEYFRGIASHLGELVTLVATSDSATAGEFYDTNNMIYPDTGLNGREAWYSVASASSADNKWTRRVVRSTTLSTQKITVVPTWPTTPRIGDTLDIVNYRGYSVTIPEIHNKIDSLLSRVSVDMAEIVTGDATTFDAIAPTLAWPANWDWLLAVEWQDSIGSWHPIFPRDLNVSPWDGYVTIKGVPGRRLNSRSLRLIGATNLTALENDDSESSVPASWLCLQAAAELKREAALRAGAPETALTLAQMMVVDAEKERDRVGSNYIPVGRRWSLRGVAAT